MVFSAEGLPDGLALDKSTGIVTGTAPAQGDYPVRLHARNSRGESTRVFRIAAGDTLALTPPMGWNHWYAHYDRITDKLVREAADVMVASGMADVGYQYVNIDDCWMNAPTNRDPLRIGPLRDQEGRLVPNRHFPDMKALVDYIHGKGLKAGIYSSPGTLTCGGFAGSYGHEAQDAQTFASWGFDFLKYDWCSYGHIAEGGDPKAPNIRPYGQGAPTLEAHMLPYRLMGQLLKEQPRDMVFNLCQYGVANVWEWGATVGGQCWRTGFDLGYELDHLFDVAISNAQHRAWSRPGAWNDPDYLQIGYVGNARGMGEPRPCPLTPDEQYTFMSLWALMAAPLFYSGDMNKLDDFSLNVLCNPEVIEVDQDPLGQSAAVADLNRTSFVMIKELEDGSKAVGLFNRGPSAVEISVPWPVIGAVGPQTVRDLWRQHDLGVFQDSFNTRVPPHGVFLVRLSKAN
jgi:alpha-galactosidase